MTENQSVIMFFDLCRLCLTSKGSIDIFDQAGLQSDITICTGIQISLSDNLPRKVCASCWDIVKKAMELRLVATKNNNHLKSLFEDGNDDISISEDLMENLVTLETNEQFYLNNGETNDKKAIQKSQISPRKNIFEEYTIEIVKPKKAKKRRKDKNKSHDKGEETKLDISTEYNNSPVISVRKDIFKKPQTPEFEKPNKANKKHTDKKEETKLDKTTDADKIKKVKKKHKKQHKSFDEDKEEQTNIDTTLECDLTSQICEVNHISRKPPHTSEIYETKKSKKRRKENKLHYENIKEETKSDTTSECDLDISKKSKKRRKEHKSEDSTRDVEKGEQTKLDTTTECDTTETDTKEIKKNIKKIGSSDDGLFYCEECPKKFDTYKKLYLHRRLHYKNIPCLHEGCEKKFATKADLEKHVRTHTGEKPFECDICKKTFTQRVTLKGHMNTFRCKSEKKKKE